MDKWDSERLVCMLEGDRKQHLTFLYWLKENNICRLSVSSITPMFVSLIKKYIYKKGEGGVL